MAHSAGSIARAALEGTLSVLVLRGAWELVALLRDTREHAGEALRAVSLLQKQWPERRSKWPTRRG